MNSMDLPKSLSVAAVPRALDRAEHFRGTGDPLAAQSACLDVLAVYPKDQRALATLILAVADGLRDAGVGTLAGVPEAEALVGRLINEYERAYYSGVVAEARARAGRDAAGLAEAMRQYEAAAAIRPAGNDDAVVRWNLCARLRGAFGAGS